MKKQNIIASFYCNLVREILEIGLRTHNRTGIDTLSIAGWDNIYVLKKGFPIAQ
ncbi:MAG: thymidylate synthase [Bacilli bacterium]|nr:thymidylate synthase [Bacilli bacterium]